MKSVKLYKCDIDDTMRELYELSKDGNEYCCEFNEKTLTSSMTIDDAYLLVTGMSYNQFKDYEKTEMEKMKKKERRKNQVGRIFWNVNQTKLFVNYDIKRSRLTCFFFFVTKH